MKAREMAVHAVFFSQNELVIKIQLCCHTGKIWYSLQSSAFAKTRSHDFFLSSSSIADLFYALKKTLQKTIDMYGLAQAKILTLSIIGEDLMPLFKKRSSILQNKELFNDAKHVLLNIEAKNRMRKYYFS